MATTSSITVPEGFTLHKENSAYILLPTENGAFLNTVQEFNRDLSVASIRVWSERNNREREAKWTQRKEQNTAKALARKAKKQKTDDVEPNEIEAPKSEYRPQKITILEPLSATGLRSIRYANEIPLVKYVIANDISPDAIAAMKRNVAANGLNPSIPAAPSVDQATPPTASNDVHGKIRINEGDACSLMYSHRTEKTRMDVVDLDPYGTAAPFIDGAVQCVSDDGLLCVTCTDLAVLAGRNYPEKCFSNYGGSSVNAEYSHEAGLRLVLHSIAQAAARYGRSIQPLLSLSIDFYVRLFVRVRSSPLEVKTLASNTAIYYVCAQCQAWHEQPLGKVVEKTTEGSNNINRLYRQSSGPPTNPECDECGGRFNIAGPMWSGPLHDKDFVKEVIQLVDSEPASFGTAARMQGMLTVASEELDVPFYFTPSRVSNSFHCNCPSIQDVSSALLHAGHQVSRSHTTAGSIKTTANRQDIHDVFRSWIKTHPVTMANIKEASPARVLLSKEPRQEANFSRHEQYLNSSVKLVRYQQNPTANWGPGSRPNNNNKNAGNKRKREKNNVSSDPIEVDDT